MDEAFDRIHKQRGVVSPNLSFMRQLQTFEQKLDLVEPSPARSPVRPLPSPCRIASNAAFWSPSEDGYRCGLSVGSLVSPLSPTSPFLSSPLLSPIWDTLGSLPWMEYPTTCRSLWILELEEMGSCDDRKSGCWWGTRCTTVVQALVKVCRLVWAARREGWRRREVATGNSVP